MILTDTVTVDDSAVKFTREGFLVANVRAARTGVQSYTAAELQLTDRAPNERINVYRDPAEVFAVDSLRSFSMIDATIDHPKDMVDAKNWRDLAVGSVGESALRDGEFLMLPLILKDADAIEAWRAGKKQLSVGYDCELVLEDGTAPDGTAYQARQTAIRANHLALCDVARGGPALRIGDSAVTLKTITFDGLPVADVSPAAEAVITKLQGQLADANTAKAAAETQVATLTTSLATKDAEIATLTKQVADSKLTPAQLRDAAKAFALTAAKARALGVTVADDADEAAIQTAVVTAKMGDAAKGWNADQVAASFAVLTKDVKVGDAAAGDPLAAVIASGPVSVGDIATQADEAWNKSRQSMSDAWKTPAKAA